MLTTTACAGKSGMRHNGLLTHEDFDSRPAINVRNTLNWLFECDAVPIINENDTNQRRRDETGRQRPVGGDGHEFASAPLLVILSVVDGLYRAASEGGGAGGEVVPLVSQIDEALPRARPRASMRPGDRRNAEQARGARR